MSAEIGNLVCDAVADPPRKSQETNLREQIRIDEQRKKKTQTANSEVNNDSDKRNDRELNHENGSVSDDRDSNQERQQEKKTKRKSRKNNNTGSRGGMTINNVVSGSTNVCINFSNQTQINVNPNGASASRKDREKSSETTREMPDYILDLTKCQSTITNLDKLTTKKNIGKNWKKVAKYLDLNKSDVEQCHINHSEEGIGEVMFKILSLWSHTHGKQATLGALIKALWTAQEYICAEELAILHKSE